ncbi:MAG: RQC domain-containing protein [Bacteroidota bacterium]
MHDQPYNERPFALTEPAQEILKTLMFLDRPYSAAYVARILQGDTRYELRKVVHSELETFGSLEVNTRQQIIDMIYYLIDQGYIEVKNQAFGTIAITQMGENFLSQPEAIELPRKELFSGWSYFQLMQELRTIRQGVAEAQHKEAYEVFTNHTMTLLLRHMPVDESALLKIPGIADLERATQLELLMAITKMSHKVEEDGRSGIYSRAYSPSHRKVKELFEEKFPLEDIAQRQGLTVERVRECLFNLHRAREIDLLPHIPELIDAQSLHKGVEYFKQVEDQRLKPAHEVLGLSYDTLKLCRLQAYPAVAYEAEGHYAAA